jgi:hypothetical protein
MMTRPEGVRTSMFRSDPETQETSPASSSVMQLS